MNFPISQWSDPEQAREGGRLVQARPLAEQIFLRAFEMADIMNAATRRDPASYEAQAKHLALIVDASLSLALVFVDAFNARLFA